MSNIISTPLLVLSESAPLHTLIIKTVCWLDADLKSVAAANQVWKKTKNNFNYLLFLFFHIRCCQNANMKNLLYYAWETIAASSPSTGQETGSALPDPNNAGDVFIVVYCCNQDAGSLDKRVEATSSWWKDGTTSLPPSFIITLRCRVIFPLISLQRVASLMMERHLWYCKTPVWKEPPTKAQSNVGLNRPSLWSFLRFFW